ncbi:MAG: septation protein IspZ [Bdellovibrionia bacterium]
MKLPTRISKVVGGAAYVLTNFAASIVFYLTFHKLGAKAAIGLAIFVTGLQLLFHYLKRQRPTIFFIISTVFIILFGGIDLFISTPRFFRLEPFVQNFAIASGLFFTYLARVPMLSRFAVDLPMNFRPKQELPLQYYRKLTLILIVYLYVKALVFLLLAFIVDLGSLILLRSILGGGSLFALFLGEFFYRKKYLETEKHKPTQA